MKLESIAGLVIDFSIYPRHDIDAANVRSLTEALEAGLDDVPPIVACRKSKKIIDGVHRWRALIRLHGDQAKWYVHWESMATDRQRFLRAIELNARHGVRLSQYDRAHCLVIATRFQISEDDLAAGFGISREAFATSTRDRFASSSRRGAEPEPLKRTIKHMAGKKLTERQQQANEKLAGFPVTFYAEQVIEVIEAGLLDGDEKTLAVLRRLYDVLRPIVKE